MIVKVDRVFAGADRHGELQGDRACEHQPLSRVHGELPQGDLGVRNGLDGGSHPGHREVPQQLDCRAQSDPRGGGGGGGLREGMMRI